MRDALDKEMQLNKQLEEKFSFERLCISWNNNYEMELHTTRVSILTILTNILDKL